VTIVASREDLFSLSSREVEAAIFSEMTWAALAIMLKGSSAELDFEFGTGRISFLSRNPLEYHTTATGITPAPPPASLFS